jgi:hypothetical protein
MLVRLSIRSCVRGFLLIILFLFHASSWNLFCSLFLSISKLYVVKFNTILTSLAGVLPLYLIINVTYRVCHLSGYWTYPTILEWRTSEWGEFYWMLVSEILANMTQVSNVTPGPLVLYIAQCFENNELIMQCCSCTICMLNSLFIFLSAIKCTWPGVSRRRRFNQNVQEKAQTQAVFPV